VRIEQQQEIRDDLHFVWLYEGPQWKQKVYAGGALAAIMAVVMFPLWPVKLRLGVWYLSMGMLGLIGLFFAMAIFRLILFCITVFTVPPGLWLYPNLFEDVGFFDSFRPVWGWQEVSPNPIQLAFPNQSRFTTLTSSIKDKKKKSKRSKKNPTDSTTNGKAKSSTSTNTIPTPSAPLTTGSEAAARTATSRDLTPRVEEVEED